MKKICIGLLCTILLTAICLTDSKAQVVYQAQEVSNTLVLPTFVANAKDGSNRLFYVLKGGIIKVRNPATGAVTDFLNISSKVATSVSIGDERGLLGLAFHPQFATNGRFFVNYTCTTTGNPACPSSGATTIAEYAANTGNQTGNAASERILITIPQPFTNHNGGMLAFGPDGYLYDGQGDGGSANDPGARAQNRTQLLGKILRIDVNVPQGSTEAYLIPPTNPYTGAGTAKCPTGSTTAGNCQEIFTYGMRNPWRFSFDRGGTNQLYAGDVGQGAIEEIDIIQNGKNYGWRVYEGTQCTGLDTALCAGGGTPIVQEPPIYQYDHSSGRCSITGGYVYRGRRGTFPQGAYIYADYCTGEIWMLQGTTNSLVLDTPFQIVTFGEDEAGEIYFASNSTTNGTVQRLVNPSAPIPRNIVADFDGDLKTDASIFRPSTGGWTITNSFNGTNGTINFGISSDIITPADFDGDGKTDVAVFRAGNWYWLDSSTSTFRAFQFGAAGDIPLASDYDGDRKSDHAVFRGGNWYIWRSQSNSFSGVQWGLSNDQPVPADYDGDGLTDISVRRASNNTWYILRSTGGFSSINWGTTGDRAVPGDYDGDGKYDVAVYREPPTGMTSGGNWYALQSSNGALYARTHGSTGGTTVQGDYDGDGKTDPAIVHIVTGNVWYLLLSNGNINKNFVYGLDTDRPVPAFDIP